MISSWAKHEFIDWGLIDDVGEKFRSGCVHGGLFDDERLRSGCSVLSVAREVFALFLLFDVERLRSGCVHVLIDGTLLWQVVVKC